MIETSTEVETRVEALADALLDAQAAIQPDLETNTQTPQQIGNLRATTAQIVIDFRALRSDLDALDSQDLILTQQSADRLSGIWRWERDTRRDLQDFIGTVVETDRTFAQLDGQSDRGTYTTREGETLQSIAQNELGDFAAWPQILEANPGLLPGLLPSGTTLVIPERR